MNITLEADVMDATGSVGKIRVTGDGRLWFTVIDHAGGQVTYATSMNALWEDANQLAQLGSLSDADAVHGKRDAGALVDFRKPVPRAWPLGRCYLTGRQLAKLSGLSKAKVDMLLIFALGCDRSSGSTTIQFRDSLAVPMTRFRTARSLVSTGLARWQGAEGADMVLTRKGMWVAGKLATEAMKHVGRPFWRLVKAWEYDRKLIRGPQDV